MKTTFAVGLCAGVFAAVLVLIEGFFALPSWLGFITMLSYFATEGGKKGFLKSAVGNTSGLIWGWVILALNEALTPALGAPYALAIIVIPIVVLMCLQSKWELLSYTPGVFAGASMLFASGAGAIADPALYTNMLNVFLAIVIGNVGALAAQQLGIAWGAKLEGDK